MQQADSNAAQLIEKIDDFHTKSGQLRCLLTVLYGEGGDAFRNKNEEIQDNVIWLAADLATEVHELAHKVTAHNAG